jgi:hypothetical protein
MYAIVNLNLQTTNLNSFTRFRYLNQSSGSVRWKVICRINFRDSETCGHALFITCDVISSGMGVIMAMHLSLVPRKPTNQISLKVGVLSCSGMPHAIHYYYYYYCYYYYYYASRKPRILPRDPSRWPRGTLYSQKLALTSATSGGQYSSLADSGHGV